MTTTYLLTRLIQSNIMSMQRQAISTTYWDTVNEKDRGQETSNPHILATRIVNSTQPITAHHINEVLAHQDIHVTVEEFETLKAIKPVRLDNLYADGPTFTGVMGVYGIMNLVTGSYYFGSSISLWERIKDYVQFNTSKKLRPVLQDIFNTGIAQFTFFVYVLPEGFRNVKFMLVLEQYHILQSKMDSLRLGIPNNNSLLVVGSSPGGQLVAESNSINQSIPVYMYVNNVLTHVFTSTSATNPISHQNSAQFGTGLSVVTLRNLIKNGTLYLDMFLFTRTILDPSDVSFANHLTAEEVKNLITEQKKVTFTPRGRPKSTTPAITISHVDGGQWDFPNIRSARTWLANVKGTHVAQDTIMRRIQSGVPLNGFTYKLK